MKHDKMPSITCSKYKWIIGLMLLFQLPLSICVCPSNCDCFNGFTKINCSNKGLQTVPALPKESIRIYLDKNNISIIQDGNFNHLNQLEFLSLSGNQISHIDAGAFQGLENLEELDLSNNKLTFSWQGSTGAPSSFYGESSVPYPCTILRGLKTLKTLNLQQNRLEKVLGEAGYSCMFQDQIYTLKTLGLSHNNISDFAGELLTRMSLEYLDLSINSLQSVPVSLPPVVTLNLSHNHIACVNTSNTGITETDLSYNPFNCSEVDCIQHLSEHSTKYSHFTEKGKYVCHNPEKCNGQDISGLDLTNLCQSGLSTTKKILAAVMGVIAGLLTMVLLWMCYTRNLFKMCKDRWRSFRYKEVPREFATYHI